MNTLTTIGIESLRAAVVKDLEGGAICEGACTHKTMHKYCDKYHWILERADMYAALTGKSREDVLTAWENQRHYWYMNFYQDCNQPPIRIDGIGVKVVLFDDWIADLQSKYGKNPAGWVFICPACKGEQKGQDFVDAGIPDFNGKVYNNCIGRYVKGIGCNWTLGGLLSIHSKVVVRDMQVFPVFETSSTNSNHE